MKALSINWYKIPVGIRRFLGVLLLFILAYWTFTFSVKLICYLLYAGTEIIDGFFKFLVGWGERMKIIKTIWYSLFTKNSHAVGIVTVDTGEEIKCFIGTGEGKSSKKDAKRIVENEFRFYPGIFEVQKW